MSLTTELHIKQVTLSSTFNGKTVTIQPVIVRTEVVSGDGGTGVDTFATLNGTILTLTDGQTYDLQHVVDTDTDTFCTINAGVITFPDGSTVDLGTIDTDTFATINGNIITFSDGSTRDITPVIDTDTDTYATLTGAVITFEDGQTIDLTTYDNTINSTTVGEPIGANVILNVVSLTQAEYDTGTPISTTLYIITDA